MGIGKLFGRKPEPSSEHEKKTLALPPVSPPPAADQPSASSKQGHETPKQVFGLNFTFGNGESKTFTSLPITIGRSEKNDLVLKDMAVSSVHARIYYDETVKDICIQDNNSLNGLFIDDQPTRKNILYDGVKLRLGDTALTFRDTGYIQKS